MDTVLPEDQAAIFAAIQEFFKTQDSEEASEQLLDCLQLAIGNAEFEPGPHAAELMDTIRRVCTLLRQLQPFEFNFYNPQTAFA